MKLTTENPLVSWLIWAVILLCLFFSVMAESFIEGLKGDKSGITGLILILFVAGIVCSFLQALRLCREWSKLRKIRVDKEIPDPDGEDGIIDLIATASDLNKKGATPSFTSLIFAYQSRKETLRRVVTLISAILVTLGLLGTILGLIDSVSGLNKLINSVLTSREELISGMRVTISGMGTAFYTTLFGSLFGGVVLRVMVANLSASLTAICVRTVEFVELEVYPRHVQDAASGVDIIEPEKARTLIGAIDNLYDTIRPAGDRIDDSISMLEKNFSVLGKTVTRVENDIKQLSLTMLDSRLLEITSNLEAIGASLTRLRPEKIKED